MNKKINDGGVAFPNAHTIPTETHPGWKGKEGMSLRDWFAGMALSGRQLKIDDDTDLDVLAEVYYKMADALIERRLK